MKKNLLKAGLALVMMMSLVTYGATIAHWDMADPGAVNGGYMPGNGERKDLGGSAGMDTTDFRISSRDLSGNGNHLTAWTSTWMKWTSDSFAGNFSMTSANDYPAAGTDSEYNAGLTGINAETITPAQWTVQALFKSSDLSSNRTIVGRDGKLGNNQAPLYLSTRGNHMAIEFTDVSGIRHTVDAAAGLVTGRWYNVAGVSNGTTLSLYINGILLGNLDMTGSSPNTALAADIDANGDTYGWSVARGMYGTNDTRASDHVDRFFGKVDEVAISDVALNPASFVIAIPQTPPAAPSGLAATAASNIVFLDWADNTEFVVYNVYRSTSSGGSYTSVATGLVQSSYRDNTAINGTTYYYVVKAVGAFNESDPSTEVWATPNPILRYMEKLDRGVVAVKVSGGVYVGWRMFGTDPASIGFNVYRGTTKLNATPITATTNYLDSAGTTSSTYSIVPVIGGVAQTASQPVSVWDSYCRSITLAPIDGDYQPNDASVGDLDGDGEYEIVIKRLSTDESGTSTRFHMLEAYKLDGTFMWRINLGPNNLYANQEINPMVYDFDGDGRAEVALRTCEGNIDGTGVQIGDTDGDGKTDYRSSASSPGSGLYMTEGPEFLSIFDGQTGREIARTAYIERDPISQWGGSGLGQNAHRADKCMMTPAYIDGPKPSLVICRGIYERIKMEAWNFRDGSLSKVWSFDTDNWPGYAQQGNHNLTVGDVDNDGLDEIVYGSMCVDNDGHGLYTTGLGHGDAIHMSDMIPDRPGLEVFACLEHPPYGTTLRDARTGEILWQKTAGGDTGRCCAAHIDWRYPGYQMWSVASGGTYNATDKALISTNIPNYGNFLIWWDGDEQREILDDISGHNSPIINKWGGDGAGRLLSLYNVPSEYGTSSNNGTKGTPCLSGDILGDWREECIYRSSDNTQLRIFTTPHVTTHRIYTLMHDSQYRTAIAWQCNMYNQPPHPSFYIGAGMSDPPVPNIVLVGTPMFTTDPINNIGAVELEMYAGQSLATYANDVDGLNTVTFSKVAGPDWLAVAGNGAISGVPGNSDVGLNNFTVRVTDNEGLYDTATMTIDVANVYSGTEGLTDLLGLATQWLSLDCVDVPACDGADLDGDDDVTITDFTVMAHNWLGDEALQLYLQLDETSGDTARDSSIYNRPGTLTNGPTWSTGHIAGALSFGGTDDYVEIPSYPGVTGTASRTCCAWIKTSATVQECILSWGADAAGQKWILRTESNGSLSAAVWNGYVNTATTLNNGQWHHVAAVLDSDGTPSANEIRLYIDGVLQSTTASSSQAIDTIASQNVMIGAFKNAGVATGYFNGLIDEVRIYNRSMTSTEIADLAK